MAGRTTRRISLFSCLILCLCKVRGEFLQRDSRAVRTPGSGPRVTVVAPDVLRLDSEEKIYLQVDGLTQPIQVFIRIQDVNAHPVHVESTTLSPENGFSVLKPFTVPSGSLSLNMKKYAYLWVEFEGVGTVNKRVLISFHSGYIFIQTDKPIYNPGDTVRYRAFVSSPSFKAFNSSISVDIKNPEGVVVKQVFSSRAGNGIFKDTFLLSEFVNEGTWTVIAKFDERMQNTFSSQFEVKKYVLPAFNVTLTPRKSYVDLEDSEVVVEISARYLYGEPVQGRAYVVFGVVIDNEMRRLPSVKQVPDLESGVATLSMAELRSAYPDLRSLVGKSLYVKASVLTATGSDLVEATKTGMKIVESPYVLTFKDLPSFYKGGLPLDFTIQVSHHDGSPAHGVPVSVDRLEQPVTASRGAASVSINMPDETWRPLTITATTAAGGLRREQQASRSFTVRPYRPENHRERNYLHISTGTKSLSAGERLQLQMTIRAGSPQIRQSITHITYLVLSKGKIVAAERVDVSGQTVSSVGLSVTQEMMPSFRVVAFYVAQGSRRNELVADSIWVELDRSCIGGLQVGPANGVARDYAPGKRLDFKVRGQPGACVALVAVDNAVYLLNKARLTQGKIWSVVEGGDTGCVRFGGPSALEVLRGAGLLYISNTGIQTPPREELQCRGGARKRRSAERLERKAQLEKHYAEKLERRCCADGLREIPMPYSCYRRSLFVTEGRQCMLAFRYCCATYRDQEYNTHVPTTLPPITTTAAPTTTTTTTSAPRRVFQRVGIQAHRRTIDFRRNKEPVRVTLRVLSEPSTPVRQPERKQEPQREKKKEAAKEAAAAEEEEEEEEEEYQDETEVYLRSKFFESWLWTEVELPGRAESDGLASTVVGNPLPDSITEWGVLAVSASPSTGFCVADPYNVRAWKPFFVDLKLPYSVARKEQIQIKAVVHNYGSEDLHVRVVLMKTEGICSVAFKDRHVQEVTLPAGGSKVVRYTIMPLVVGMLPIEVVVLARDMMGSDRIQKSLRVVMDGIQKTEVWSAMLNPSAENGTQRIRVERVKLRSVVPNSVPETFVNVRGNVLADSIDNSISGDSLASLIRMPGGCVEQNLASITLPLIATLYLERSGNWESVGLHRKDLALGYIKKGYENQLAYKKRDGSYPPYRREGASTWITAYVVKVFSMAHSIVGISQQQVCDPLVYLLNHKLHMNSGKFEEKNPVYSPTMIGGLRGNDPDVTLTAFVLIALAEAKQAGIQCSGAKNMELAVNQVAKYLWQSVSSNTKRRPYTVAIAAYALALLKNPAYIIQKDVLLGAAAGGGSHWPDRHNALFTLEATGYALLALVKMGHQQEASVAFKWLNGQRRVGGGFGSTQSTMVVLQALSEYLVNTPHPSEVRLDVDVAMSGRKEVRYHFNPMTAYAARTSRLPPNVDMEVVAQGNGQGILEVVTHYNQLHDADAKTPCNNFELDVSIEESIEKPPADVEKSYTITIKVRALAERDVRMAILDISLPTGFTPENSDLELLYNSVDRYINNFQIVDNLSDRGSLIIHLFKVSRSEPDILIFRLQQNFKVGLLQPSSVTVYEYYNPDHRCTRTYTPREDTEELTHICRDNICRCTQGDCAVSKEDSENFPNHEREILACQSLHHVFQVKVLNITHSYYDKYNMEVTQVVKLGLEAGVEAGQTRTFMSDGGCREGLHLQEGSEYLIIGPKDDAWSIDTDTNRYVYMLGKNTWVERWPSSAECTSSGLSEKCRSLEESVYDLAVNGCRA